MLDEMEQVARIEQLNAETQKMTAETRLLFESFAKTQRENLLIDADTRKRKQEIAFAPWSLVLQAVGATVAVMSAGAAVFAVLVKWIQ